jgi:hypothetical protein
MRSAIRTQLAASIPPKLVDELLDAHAEAKRNFYLGGLRLSEVEGGRFCEAAFRILEHVALGTHTPLGAQLGTEKLIERLGNLPKGSFSDSIRLHLPRALRMVYDIRNKRDAAHLADGIDPNLQDATLVVSALDWVLAELVRLHHNVTANDATAMVDQIVTRSAPTVQDFDGFLKILNPSLAAGDYVLLLLYQRGARGAELAELTAWVRPAMRPNLRRTVGRLVDDLAFAHYTGDRYLITRTGEQEVERRKLLQTEA